MKKGYLLGALCSPLLGLLTWKLLFPQISGLDGIYIFFLGFFCLWTAAAILLGLLSPDSPRPYRWGYAAIFFLLFLNQLGQAFFHFPSYILVDILELSFLYLLQHFEHRQKGG